MRFLATAALTGLLLAGSADAQTISSRTHNTGTAGLRVFNNGFFGGNVGIPAPPDTTFLFGGGSPLYEGQLIVGVNAAQVSGQPYSDNPTGTSPNSGFEWTFGPRPTSAAPPAPFNQAFTTAYTDGGTANTSPAGLSVSQRTLSRTGDDFVIVEISVSSVVPRTGLYVGIFADYDISATAVADRGNFDAPTRTVYSFSAATGGNRNYYGVSLLGRAQSGWSVSSATTDADLFTSLSTNGVAATTNADRRMVIGAGPFALAANVPQTVRFAFVGGTNLVDLQANAAVAQGLFPVAGEGSPAEAEGLALLPAVPNPAASATELSFTLDAAQDVRLAVYDVLGRQVALVAEGARGAGTHTATVDASRLPSGVYVARLTAGGQTVLRRFTVAR